MNLAIAAPSASAYSESFVKMQMDRLPCVLRVHGGPVSSETIPGGAIKPLKSVRGLIETAWMAGVKRMGWEGPQTAELVRRLRKHKIDRMLVNFGPMAVALMPACKKLNIPLVAHFHGFDAHKQSDTQKYAGAYKKLGQEAAAIVVVSQGMADALVDLGLPKEKMHLFRCGVDPSQFSEKQEYPASPMFFGVGRFVDKKAPYLALLAFAKALPKIPNAKLVLAGTGELLEATQNIAAALNLGDSVEFPGIITPDAVANYMRHATAYVQHSIEPRVGPHAGDREGTPVAVLEAMMCALPVISTRHAGIGEVIENGRTGLLVEERDIDGMAEAMVRLAQSTELAEKIGRAARVDALERHSADLYLGSLKTVLESAGGQG